MPTFYIATDGNDLTGDGSQASPFTSLEHVLGLTLEEFTLVDSTTIYLKEGSYSISKTLNPASVQNLTIRAFPGAEVMLTRDFDTGPLFSFTEMSQSLIADLKITTSYDFEKLIEIVNSNMSNLVNLTIEDIDITMATHTSKSIVELTNTYSGLNFCNFKNSNFPGQNVTLVKQTNASNITVENSTFTGITGENLTGIYCASNNLALTVDEVSITNLSASNSSKGVLCDFSATPVSVLLDNFKINEVDTGIQVSNNIPQNAEQLRIRRGEIFDTQTAINANACSGNIYNCVIAFNDYGVSARNSSKLNTYNNILFENGYALHCLESSEIRAHYTALYNNTSNFEESSMGVIFRQDFVRFINPKFVDSENRDFHLTEDSPLIDIGTDVDFVVEGAAVDIGKYDIDRVVPIEELSALTAKLITRTYRPQILGSIDTQQLLEDILAEVAPEVSTQEGSAINDLLVKPHALLYQRFIDAFMVISRNQSVLAAEFMSMDELDAFAANQYVDRIMGSLALATVRVYLAEPVSLRITPQDIFMAGSERRFFARQYIEISAAEMSLNREGSVYFVDVPVEAESFGPSYNVVAGDIDEWLGAPDIVSHVSNVTDGVPARDVETNEELINRTIFSISNRSLVNPLGISAIIREEFPEIVRTVPIGAGDPEMVRDILAGVHVYGKTDIYISAVDATIAYLDIPNISENTELSRTYMGNTPILDILSMVVLDPETGEETDVTISPSQYQLLIDSPDERFSPIEKPVLQVASELVGTDIRMKFRWSPQILTVQNYCLSDEVRVLCESVRVKHLVPVFLSFNVNYKAFGDLDHNAIIADLTNQINTFPVQTEFQVSDIIDTLYTYGADFVEQPLIVEARYHHQNGDIETKFFKNINLLPRIYGYIADEITLTRLP